MVEQPDRFLVAFANAGTDILIGHIEVLDDPAAFAAAVRRLGKQPGFAINPGTPTEKLVPHLAEAELIVVMGVHPGAGGQAFIPTTLDTVRQLRAARQNDRPLLQLDGGVNEATIGDIVAAGADALHVAGPAGDDRGGVANRPVGGELVADNRQQPFREAV